MQGLGDAKVLVESIRTHITKVHSLDAFEGQQVLAEGGKVVCGWEVLGNGVDHNEIRGVEDTELIDEVPTCYRYNQADDTFEWAPDYLPGGPHYSKREYPIMYFDAPVFPAQCRLKWIPACEFDLYDPKVPAIQFKETFQHAHI